MGIWLVGWLNECIIGWIMSAWLVGWMEGWLDGWLDGGMVGWMDGWRDGWVIDPFTYITNPSP